MQVNAIHPKFQGLLLTYDPEQTIYPDREGPYFIDLVSADSLMIRPGEIKVRWMDNGETQTWRVANHNRRISKLSNTLARGDMKTTRTEDDSWDVTERLPIEDPETIKNIEETYKSDLLKTLKSLQIPRIAGFLVNHFSFQAKGHDLLGKHLTHFINVIQNGNMSVYRHEPVVIENSVITMDRFCIEGAPERRLRAVVS